MSELECQGEVEVSMSTRCVLKARPPARSLALCDSRSIKCAFSPRDRMKGEREGGQGREAVIPPLFHGLARRLTLSPASSPPLSLHFALFYTRDSG